MPSQPRVNQEPVIGKTPAEAAAPQPEPQSLTEAVRRRPDHARAGQEAEEYRPPRRQRASVWWMLGGLVILVLAVMAIAKTTSTQTPPATNTPSQAITEAAGTQGPRATPVPHRQDIAVISPENAGRVIQLARWGKGRVNEVTYSPDGRLLAVASSLGIYLYDAEDLEEVRFIETAAWMNSIAFSPDGEMLASGARDGTVNLWRVADGSLLGAMEHASFVESVAFSPDGETLASGAWDGTVNLWRASDGSLLRTLEGHAGRVNSVAFSPDGGALASRTDADP